MRKEYIDNIQTKIDIVNETIKMYSEYIDSALISSDIPDTPNIIDNMKLNLEKELKNLEKLKLKHPEYFI